MATWRSFGPQNQFMKKLGIQFFYLFVLSMAVYLRPNSDQPLMSQFHELDGTAIARLCFELGTLLNCFSFIVFQQGNELKNQGLSGFVRQLVSVSVSNMVYSGGCGT